jgi:hypothetical protein
MRHVPQQNLRVATRGTTRAINRRIALNLIRTNQPISRADLARLMGTRRGAVSLLVGQLIDTGEVYEGATGEAKRGRKPTFLYIDSRKRCVVAVDIRTTRTFVMVTDLVGHQLASVTSFPTERDPESSSPAWSSASRRSSSSTRISAAARASASSCPEWWTPMPARCCGRPTWAGVI